MTTPHSLVARSRLRLLSSSSSSSFVVGVVVGVGQTKTRRVREVVPNTSLSKTTAIFLLQSN